MLRRALLGLAIIASLLTMTPEARADAPVTCGGGLYWDGQKCQLIASSPGSGGSSGDTGGTLSNSSKPRTCTLAGTTIPCYDPALGSWDASRSCYLRLVVPQPVQRDPVWVGNTEWVAYDCVLPSGVVQYAVWAPRSLAGPDPRVLAQTAIELMNLTPVSIGIVPEDRPGSMGLVGMPVWMWAVEPGEHTWGPITRTASAGGVSVTATAKVSRVRWLMGDGGVVVCTSPGTVYEDRFGKKNSPTCGYTYRKQGVYTVRAESQWSVAWSGMGQSGTIPLTLTQSTTISIGELQVITIG